MFITFFLYKSNACSLWRAEKWEKENKVPLVCYSWIAAINILVYFLLIFVSAKFFEGFIYLYSLDNTIYAIRYPAFIT